MTSEARPLDHVKGATRAIVERIIWCTVATVSPEGEPRSRLMHPVWFWDTSAPWALVTARPTPVKLRHLRANPHVSCFYWDPAHDTVAIDATATWLDLEARAEAWDRIAATAAPVGFDPHLIWPDGPDSHDCRILRFDAHRIVTTVAGRAPMRWTRNST